MPSFEVVQVSIGKPETIGQRRGRDVISSIRKHAVGGAVEITPDGIVGDEQADTRVVRGNRIHGGLLKAIYVYPVGHLARWAAEIDTRDKPGAFGENLTVNGLVESDVHTGDVFAWGGAILRVTKPRRPCYKLPIHLGIESVAQMMNANGRCGWYMQVVEPGVASDGDNLELIESSLSEPTIAQIFASKVAVDPSIPDMPGD